MLRKQTRMKRNGLIERLSLAALFMVVIITVTVNVLYFLRFSDKDRKKGRSFRDPLVRVEDTSTEKEYEVVSDVGSYVKVDMSEIMNEPLTNYSKMLTIAAISGKNYVSATVDGAMVYEKKGTVRGLHVLVISQYTGKAMTSRVYDTYLSSYDIEINHFLESLADGRILVFMTLDEISMKLGTIARGSISALGSKFISEISLRDSWVFITSKNGEALAENIKKLSSTKETSDADWPPSASVQATTKVSPQKKMCNFGSGKAAERRQRFCSKHDGYGNICKCSNAEEIDFQTKEIKNNNIKELPIIIIASQRPFYLYRMLKGFLQVPGVKREMVTVYIDDDESEEPSAICSLYNVKFVLHIPICTESCRISQHYRRSLKEAFEKNPSAKAVIILEEDLDVSEDFMDYFSQLYPLLEADKDLFCVSAWNDQGYAHAVHDPSMLYRVNMMPGLGWILKRSIFEGELLSKWPDENHELRYIDWDVWLRQDENFKGRDCIIPEISRTFHFGARGVNMNEFFHQEYFAKRLLNNVTGIKFNIERMKRENYDKEMDEVVSHAIVLNHKMNQCSHPEKFIPNTKGKTYVAYIKMEESIEDEKSAMAKLHKPNMHETWMRLATCFHLWDLSPRGFYKGAIRFWFKDNHIILVGVPKSPYAAHKPHHIQPIFLPKESENP